MRLTATQRGDKDTTMTNLLASEGHAITQDAEHSGNCWCTAPCYTWPGPSQQPRTNARNESGRVRPPDTSGNLESRPMITITLTIDAPSFSAATMLSELVADINSVNGIVSKANANAEGSVARVRDAGPVEAWCNTCEEWHS